MRYEINTDGTTKETHLNLLNEFALFVSIVDLVFDLPLKYRGLQEQCHFMKNAQVCEFQTYVVHRQEKKFVLKRLFPYRLEQRVLDNTHQTKRGWKCTKRGDEPSSSPVWKLLTAVTKVWKKPSRSAGFFPTKDNPLLRNTFLLWNNTFFSCSRYGQ